MRKPRALRPGDRIAVVAPASPFAREEFDAGVAELRALGFEPVYDETRVRAPPLRRRRAGRARGGVPPRLATIPPSRRSSPSAAATAACTCCRCSIRRAVAGQPEGVHRLQRQHVAPLLAHPAVRHRRRFTARCSRGGSPAAQAGTIATRSPAACAGRAARRDRAPAGRDARARERRRACSSAGR